MSPFHHALSIREEAEAALLGAETRRGDEAESVPESGPPSSDLDFDLDFESEPAPRTEPGPQYRPEK
jgi:hypothetical protein